MRPAFLLILALLTLLTSCSKVLAILDSKTLLTTHSEFFKLLSKNNELEYAYSFGKNNIELKYFDRFRYEHIIVMCTSAKGRFEVM